MARKIGNEAWITGGISAVTGTLHLLRVGHLGDVLLTEPVAAALRAHYERIILYTDYAEAGALMPVYDDVRPFLDIDQVLQAPGDRVLKLVYEIWPGINHLDGYARCARVQLPYRLPRLAKGSERVVDGDYVLLAPHTSHWVRTMRQWDPARTMAVGDLVREKLGVRVVALEPQHSFREMVSLVEHCSAFLGNDSAPAILAQCFNRKAAVIFGATCPDKVLLSSGARAIIHDVGCNGCKHFARHTEIECASPMCLELLTIDEVYGAVATLLMCATDQGPAPQQISK